jgi:ankyrin repeat protein
MTTSTVQQTTSPVAQAAAMREPVQHAFAQNALALLAHAHRLVQNGARPPTLVQLVKEMCGLQSHLCLFQTRKYFKPWRLQLTAIFQSYRPHLVRLFNPTLQTLIRLRRESDLAATQTPTLKQCKDLVAELDRESGSYTPLTDAAMEGDVAAIDALCAAGANLEAGADRGRGTPLSSAAVRGEFEAAFRLIAWGADINANGGKTLYAATHRGNIDGLQAILKLKPNLNGFWNPLSRASQENNVQAIELLVAAGADPHKNYALVIAADSGATDAVALLLQHKVDLDAIFQGDSPLAGLTALAAAAKSGHTHVVSQLLAAGASVNRANSVGYTPLFGAVYGGYVTAIQQLLDHNANPNTTDCWGHTPLALAQAMDLPGAAAMLRALKSQ